ncbi:MAG: oligopeptide transporter, OPT family [Clostridia bacterium]|nr:oligopeptide transporter, OPT family [Clostridia bacterium]
MDNQNNFKPYIPAEKITPELTVTSIIVGMLLAVIFGAANAYLGLKVGMTVSASIPSAVIAMGIIKMILRKNSALEVNMVQTIGSSGESLAAGAIFTLPALFIWASEGIMDKPSIVEITLIAIIGGLLGIFFMVPLRNALIVKEHGILPYPEGTACAEVILAGEKGGASAKTVFAGMGFAALFKFIIDGLKLVAGEVAVTFKGFAGTIGTQIYPAVMSVGYICGPRISSFMFSGGMLSWLVLSPLIVFFGGDTVQSTFAAGGAYGIWSNYIKYIGAGALMAGGFISLVKSMPLIVRTFADAIKGLSLKSNGSGKRTEKDMNFLFVIIGVVALALVIWIIDIIPVNLIGAIIIVICGFFFATVSSRMVGLVGSSNNPVSGMTIATVLVATVILKATGMIGTRGMISAISIASIVCIVTAIAGDTSQDLKTGYLLGATPVKQQVGEIVGVIASGLAIGGTLYLLDAAWGFGSAGLEAPQASMMKMIIEGVMDGNLPWALIISGAFIAIVVELLRIPVLPFAIGVYLPVQLNACIMVGGIIRLFFDRMKDPSRKETAINRGILFSSGMIAGEGLVGIALALFVVLGLDKKIDLASLLNIPPVVSNIGSLVLFAIIILTFLKFSLWAKKDKD